MWNMVWIIIWLCCLIGVHFYQNDDEMGIYWALMMLIVTFGPIGYGQLRCKTDEEKKKYEVSGKQAAFHIATIIALFIVFACYLYWG